MHCVVLELLFGFLVGCDVGLVFYYVCGVVVDVVHGDVVCEYLVIGVVVVLDLVFEFEVFVWVG